MDKTNPDNSGEFFDQFLDDYYAECDEHLVSIRRSLVALEDGVGAVAVDRALLDNLFRSFHTLKGISGMVGLTQAEELAHHLESYLRELREGSQILTEPGFAALADGVSSLEGVINARRQDQPIPAIEEISNRLQSVSSARASSPAPQSAETPATEVSIARWLIDFTPTAQLSERGVNVNSVRARLQEIGQVVQAKPVVKGAGEIAFEFIVATEADETALASLTIDGVTFKAAPTEAERKTREAQP